MATESGGVNMPEQSFGQYLRQLRLSKGISIHGLAKLSGVSHTYISQFETGNKNSPSHSVLRVISNALNVPYIDLLIKAGYLTDEEIAEYKQVEVSHINSYGYTAKQLRKALEHFNDDAEVVISVNAEKPLPIYEVCSFTHDKRVFLETERSE